MKNRILRLSAGVFAICNGYHLLNCAARLVGAHALRDALRFDPEDFAQLFAEQDTEHGL